MSQPKTRNHLHFVGIGGIGMSGIAEVFLNQGYSVSGSDLAENDSTRRLASLGARIFLGHQAGNVKDASVVVISSAVRQSNPEVLEARRLRIPVIPRAEMLGELMRGKIGIAVAGTHGKTSTTSMLASILTHAGLDPTLVIGGKVDALGGNAKLGQGAYVVAEADESDGSFLQLPATYGIVTNIDNDHMDHYRSAEALDDAFVHFVGKIPFYGLVAVCGEDPRVRQALPRFSKPFVTYGFSDEWDYHAREIRVEGMGTSFEAWSKGKCLGTARVNLPGRHNVLNALAAIAIGLALGLSFEKVAAGLAFFRGVRRRFEVRWENQDSRQVIIDDYGHHPTEVVATLAAARSCWKGRIITIFQPHRYTRTQNCRKEFVAAFNNTDVLLLTDIYSAGEDPIDGVDSKALAEEIRRFCGPEKEIAHAGDLNAAAEELLKRFRPGDLVICLGAGSITRLPEQLITRIGSRPGAPE